MGLFGNQASTDKPKKSSGILGAFSVDVIKWEPEAAQEAAVLCHKFEAEDFPNGSQLIVHPSQVAVFINNMNAGKVDNNVGEGTSQVAIFPGPCKIRLETGDSRFAPFRSLSHALTGGESAYHSAVYFINTTYMNELNWGTQAPVLVEDPEENVNVHVRAYGLFGAHIEHTDSAAARLQAGKFLRKVVGTRGDYTREELTDFMRAKILEYVPDLLAKTLIDEQVSVLKISARLSQFSALIYEKLRPFFDEIGLTLDGFSFHSINVPDEDLSVINEAKKEKQRKILEAQAEAEKRKLEGYTYQEEQTYKVLQSAAANEGTSSAFLGTGMGLGMGVGLGGAIGGEMSRVAGGIFRSSKDKSGQDLTPSEQEIQRTVGSVTCPKCSAQMPAGARFCMVCGSKVETSRKCFNCGTELPAGARFCFSCGKPQTERCPACGEKIQPGAAFCSSCGSKL